MDLDDLFERLRDTFSTRIAIGEPVERGEVTVIPAVAVRGGGGGGGEAEQHGGGFGLTARPVGAWVIRSGKAAYWEPAVDVNRLALAALAVLALALLRLRR